MNCSKLCERRSELTIPISVWAYIATFFFFSSFGCKTKSVDSEDREPRSYIWSTDTISYAGSQQTFMRRIWGTNARNLYIVGHNEVNGGQMWHFNGSTWSDVKLSVSDGGQITGAFDLADIDGFSASTIFAAGAKITANPSPPPDLLASSLIIKFDGNTWTESLAGNKEALLSIWNDSSGDIWACGRGGTLYSSSDGITWQPDSVEISLPPDATLTLRSVSRAPSGELYLLGEALDNTTGERSYYLFRREIGKWIAIDTSSAPSQWGNLRLWRSPWGGFYSLGDGGLFQLIGSTWAKIHGNGDQYTSIFGTSSNNFFVTTFNSTLLHFNGTDWYEYENLKFQGVGFVAVWTDGKEVLLLGLTSQKTIVFRGN